MITDLRTLDDISVVLFYDDSFIVDIHDDEVITSSDEFKPLSKINDDELHYLQMKEITFRDVSELVSALKKCIASGDSLIPKYVIVNNEQDYDTNFEDVLTFDWFEHTFFNYKNNIKIYSLKEIPLTKVEKLLNDQKQYDEFLKRLKQ